MSILVLLTMTKVTNKIDILRHHFVNSTHFKITAASPPAEQAGQPWDKGPTVAELSFLIACHYRPNQLKWVLISCTVQEGAGVKVFHPFLMEKNHWMDLMMAQHLLVDQLFSAMFERNGKARKPLLWFWANLRILMESAEQVYLALLNHKSVSHFSYYHRLLWWYCPSTCEAWALCHGYSVIVWLDLSACVGMSGTRVDMLKQR